VPPKYIRMLETKRLEELLVGPQSRRRIRAEELTWVLQSLLDERVPVRRLNLILEVLLRRPVHPLAAVRAALASDVVSPYLDHESTLHVIAPAPLLERQITRGDFRVLLQELHPEMERLRNKPFVVTLLCSPGIRFRLRRLLFPLYPELPVICWDEIPPGTGINTVGLLRTQADERRQLALWDQFRLWRAQCRR